MKGVSLLLSWRMRVNRDLLSVIVIDCWSLVIYY